MLNFPLAMTSQRFIEAIWCNVCEEIKCVIEKNGTENELNRSSCVIEVKLWK